jgi:hypothetical protein
MNPMIFAIGDRVRVDMRAITFVGCAGTVVAYHGRRVVVRFNRASFIDDIKAGVYRSTSSEGEMTDWPINPEHLTRIG